MADVEKVKQGLKLHSDGCGYRSYACDYMECPYRYGDESCDIEELTHDALSVVERLEKENRTLKLVILSMPNWLNEKRPEVVRCKDCRFGEEWGQLVGCGSMKGFGITHKPDWYCADGEWKDGDDNG